MGTSIPRFHKLLMDIYRRLPNDLTKASNRPEEALIIEDMIHRGATVDEAWES